MEPTPGTPIGIIASQQAMSEGVQSSLSAFHKLGVEDETTDLLGLYRSMNKLASITFKINNCEDRYCVFNINRELIETSLRDILWYTLVPIDVEPWYQMAMSQGYFIGNQQLSNNIAKMRFIIDVRKMLVRGLTLKDIAIHIFEKSEVHSKLIIWSPFKYGIIDFICLESYKPTQAQIILDELVIKGRADVKCITWDLPKAEIYASGLYPYLSKMNHVYDIVLRAPSEVCKYFGIEAARSVLNTSIMDKSEPMSHKARIFADSLTRDGTVDKIGKVSMDDNSVLTSMSLEKPKRDITELIVLDSMDDLRRPHSRLVVGSTPRVGTHYFDIIDVPSKSCEAEEYKRIQSLKYLISSQ